MSVVDHKGPQPLLEQVRILPLGQMELGVQGNGFDPVVAVASPLNADLAEDRKIGTRPSCLQARKFLVRLGGRIARYRYGRTDVPRTGHFQERLEQPSPDNQKFSE